MKEAQQRFAELASGSQANEAALLYLADIAARDGDTDAAIAGYRRLYDSSSSASSSLRHCDRRSDAAASAAVERDGMSRKASGNRRSRRRYRHRARQYRRDKECRLRSLDCPKQARQTAAAPPSYRQLETPVAPDAGQSHP